MSAISSFNLLSHMDLNHSMTSLNRNIFYFQKKVMNYIKDKYKCYTKQDAKCIGGPFPNKLNNVRGIWWNLLNDLYM